MATTGYKMNATADGGGTGGASRCFQTADGIWWVCTRETTDADQKLWKYDDTIPASPGDTGGFAKAALAATGDVEFSDKSSHRGNIFYDPANSKLHSFFIKNNSGNPESEYNRHSYNTGADDWTKDFAEESPSVVSGSAYTGRHHGITADSNGVAWLPHYDFTANAISVEYRTLTGSWTGGPDIRDTGDGTEPGTGESALAVFPWNNAGVPSIGVIFVWGGEYGFAYRADSAALSAAWTYETLWAAASAPTLDNHLHGIAYDSGSETTSRICVCMKSGDGSDIYATRRNAAGAWATPVEVGVAATAHTECTIAVDETNDEMYVFYTTATSQVSLFYDKSPTGTMSWGGTDTVAIEDATPTASKGFCGVPIHAVDSAMDLMVIVDFDGTNQGWNLLTIAGAGGAISASLPIVHAVVADLKAQGKLDAALALVYGIAADLKGPGQLIAPLDSALNVAADLKASGQLVAPLNVVFDTAAELQAIGDATATLSAIVSVTADLKARGKADAALGIVFSIAAALADAGSAGPIDAVLPIVFGIAADLKASGELDLAAELVFGVVADLKATGALNSSLAIAFNLAADLAGQGKADAALELVYLVTADLKAAGKLDAALAMIFSIVADLKDQGGLEVALPIVFSVAAALTNATPLPAADKMADPSIHRRAKPAARRLYAKQWNQIAETYDAFLRRQETLVRSAVQETPTIEEAEEYVVEAPVFQKELGEMRNVIREQLQANEDAATAAAFDAELDAAVEHDVVEMILSMRDEEDILALVAMLVTSTNVLH